MNAIPRQIRSTLFLMGLVVLTLSATSRADDDQLDSIYGVGYGVGANVVVTTGGFPYGYGWWGWGYGYPVYGYSYLPYYYPQYIPTYGAISYSVTTGKFGGGWGYSYQNDAISSANAGCGSEDCRTVVWVQGGCAAVATSESTETRRLGWSYANTRYQAESYAMRNCRAGGIPGCKVQAWVCSF